MNPDKYLYNNGEVGMSDDEAAARWFVPILLALVILACSAITIGEQGIKDNQHRGPVPAGITQLKPDLYLRDGRSGVDPNSICLNGGGGDPAVTSVTTIPGKSVDLIDCYSDQQWNVKAGPPRSFIPDGIVATLTAPWYWGALGGLLILFFPYGYVWAFRKRAKLNKALRKQEAKSLDEQRSLLIAQWTKSSNLDLDDPGYISDEDFETRLGQLDERIARARA